MKSSLAERKILQLVTANREAKRGKESATTVNGTHFSRCCCREVQSVCSFVDTYLLLCKRYHVVRSQQSHCSVSSRACRVFEQPSLYNLLFSCQTLNTIAISACASEFCCVCSDFAASSWALAQLIEKKVIGTLLETDKYQVFQDSAW